MRYLQNLPFTGLATGASAEATWSPETDVKIRRIMVTERASGELSNIHAYITIGDNPITKPTVPCRVFGANKEQALEANIDLVKGTKLYVKLTNGTGGTVNVDVVLEIE